MSKLITGQDCRVGFDFQHVFQYENPFFYDKYQYTS